jgi:hypothetical protein
MVFGSRLGQGMLGSFFFYGYRRACFEAETVIAGFEDVAAVGQRAEQVLTWLTLAGAAALSEETGLLP